MICKNCIHYEPCFEYGNILDPIHGGVVCDSFKNKADYVEVVKCKDCEHYHIGKESVICDYDYCDILYYCDGSHRTACEEDYCSYGKRKDRTIV